MNPLEYYKRPNEFKRIFGLSKDHFLVLLEMVEPKLTPKRPNVLNLNPITKLAVFIDFLRTNNFHRTCSSALWANMSETQANLVVNQCARAFADLTPKVGIQAFAQYI